MMETRLMVFIEYDTHRPISLFCLRLATERDLDGRQGLPYCQGECTPAHR